MHEKQAPPHMPEALPEYKTGTLPAEAPLAVPFVPFQKDNPLQYNSEDGLTRGTMFPGLDLPFHNNVNNTNPSAGTLLGEVQALEFALVDLHLYLDTHPHDASMIKMVTYYTDLLKKAKKDYEARFGPLTHESSVQDGKFLWLQDPWPWEYQERSV